MTYAFSKVLEMSLYGSIAIVAVMIFRRVFRKCPRRVILLFWLAVAIRLACPFNFSSPMSVLNIGKLFSSKTESSEAETIVVSEQVPDTATLHEAAGRSEGGSTVSVPGGGNTTVPGQSASSGVDAVAQDGPVTSVSQKPVQESGNTKSITRSALTDLTSKEIFSFVWFSGLILLVLFFTIRYIAFYRSIRKGQRGKDGVYCLDTIDTPFVIGFFRPRLCVPSHIDEEEKEYILRHESVHIKHRDGLIKLLCYLILCVHWFNPLVWAAFLMVCADLEMRADEEVIRGLGMETKKAYCISIVNHAVKDPAGSFMQNTAFSGLGFGGMEAKMRVKNLLKKTKVSKRIQVIALVFSLSIALMLSACAYEYEKKSDATTDKSETTESTVATDTSVETSVSETTSSDTTAEASDTAIEVTDPTDASTETSVSAPEVVTEPSDETKVPSDGVVTEPSSEPSDVTSEPSDKQVTEPSTETKVTGEIVTKVESDIIPSYYNVPQINIDAEEIRSVNMRIKDDAVDPEWGFTGVDYQVFHHFDGIYSLVIDYSLGQCMGYYSTYTFDTNGHVYSASEILALAGVAESEFFEKTKEASINILNDMFTTEDGIPLIVNGELNPDNPYVVIDSPEMDLFRKDLSETDINLNMPMIINNQGRLCVCQGFFEIADPHDGEIFFTIPDGKIEQVVVAECHD
ncbi:MAG: hypothetical protein J5752_00585 [Clostridiales bacterium]|nr:hypothetical protein [Clostridiales bacterium]